MSEVGAPGAGAPAPAPAETSVPVPDSSGPRIPNPATGGPPPPSENEVSQGQPPSGKERRSISDSLDKAFEAQKTEPPTKAQDKVEPKAKPEPKAEPKAKPEAKAEPAAAKSPPRERDDGGRFASSQAKEDPAPEPVTGQPDYSQPPRNANFSREATAEWANTPEPVKADIHRRLAEQEAGIHKYREAAEAYHEVRQFDELAKATGTTLPRALANYVTIEKQLASDDPAEKWEGIQRVLKRANVDPRQLASAILNQPLPPQEQQSSELNQRLQAYERKIAQLEQTQQQQVQKQQFNEINGSVKAFASERPRFDELSLEIASYLNGRNDRGIHINPRLPADQRLQQAYQLAEELNPSAARSSPLAPEPRPANGAGTKSIAGSPANGSNPSLPAQRKGQRPSIKDSVDRAFARLGSS